MNPLRQQEILTLVHAGKCNIEVSNFGTENEAVLIFAGKNLELITVDDIEIGDERIYIVTDKIVEKFTKNWANYQGEGCLSIELCEVG